MANFDPPIASVGGVTRPPSVLEKANGLQCGPADLKLFNFLFQRIQAELKSIQDAGGIVGDDGDDTTVLQAILELISSATGGGDPANYVQFPQAQARLPIFPEAQTADGKISVTSLGGGNIRAAGGVTILHRGIRPYSTTQADFATTASKIYHVRWTTALGYVLKDLVDIAYNPTGVPETNSAFDTTFDDVLVARVVTSPANVPTITPLVNKDRLFHTATAVGTDGVIEGDAFQFTKDIIFDHDLARTPKMVSPYGVIGNGGLVSPGLLQTANRLTDLVSTRYRTAFKIASDFHAAVTSPFYDARLTLAA